MKDSSQTNEGSARNAHLPFGAAIGAQSPSSALRGLRVLDLTRVRSGPAAVRQLADWGADVIAIETLGGSDLGGDRGAGDFQNLHRNKRSISLNLKSDEGLDILRRLARNADVLVENFRPDVKRRLGIDYESLREINMRLVYASISGFGQNGPYSGRPGIDQIAQGMAGLMSITGAPDDGPMRAGIAIADLSAGLYCALGILVALLEREKSGEGQWVHTSLLQAQLALLDFQAARWLVEGERPSRLGNNHPTMAPCGVYPTADGHINVAALGEAMWRSLCDVIGSPELADDVLFAAPAARTNNLPALTAALSRRFETRPSHEWIAALNEAGVPCGPINSVEEAFADEQVKHLGIVQAVTNDAGRQINLVGQPIVMSRTPSTLVTAAPLVGAHTEEVLAEIGIDADQFRQLRIRGVV